MPRGAPEVVARGEAKTVVKVFDDLFKGKNPHPCSCELQRERQTVDTPADGDDVCDLRRAQLFAMKRQLCAVAKELDRLGVDGLCDALARVRER